MQNEKLFDQIKHTALTETVGTEDFDSERVWADIQNRDRQETRVYWWPYAVASIVLILLTLLLNLPEIQTQNSVAHSESKPEVIVENSEYVRKDDRSDELTEIQKSKRIASLKTKAREDTVQPTLAAVKVDTNISDLGIPTSTFAENPLAIRTDSAGSEPSHGHRTKQKGERVLVANIDLPEPEINEPSGLKRMYDQIKKDREARRMRVQINKQVGKATLWSFVHQSFVESPPVQPQQNNSN